MSDVTLPENQPFFNLARAFLKGASLEMPNAPTMFLDESPANLEFNLQPANKKLDKDLYEVALRCTLTAKRGEKVVYLLEVETAGVFEIRNIPDNEKTGLLEVHCNAILATYLRTHISDFQTRATLPVFLIPEINFAAMYQQKLEQLAAAPAGSSLIN
ncbi:protein-export chaperone SecB [Paraburkholderia sp. UCT31]|uniref:protein-export chaperone SecB n=1 Tax=Paraburkholderia sp. UCT31 TaxID=2615209 RepID=UPI00165652B4|nr:protein-export chaperone SecB [Paraburkholderia sp. UCT31]MBC8739721.1 protein-export chaperone SecB [Paraburkholderia sp. UCT31]